MRLAATARWRTDRIECFLLEPAHASETYAGWLNDVEVNRFLESRFATQTAESVTTFIAAQLADPRALFLGIRCRELDRHVGNIKLAPIDTRHGLGEVGIMIGDRGAWGRGIGSDAIRVIADIARDELGLRKLTAGLYASNAGSERAFIKAGFHVEGRRAGHVLLEGRPEDVILLARFLS